MDYVLVTYLAARASALSYAVGEWARIWLLKSLIRSMGAYFIRRDSRDSLYRKILARYVHMATAAGVVQAVFPEGGLSRDGALRPPKLGLLSYMVSEFDPRGDRDVVFIPVGVNYDRVIEDRVLTSAIDHETTGRPMFRVSIWSSLKFVLKGIILALRSRWYRYGYACVSFGEPISLRRYLADQSMDFRLLDRETRQRRIGELGEHLMGAVGAVVPALPVSIVSSVLLEHDTTPMTAFELKGRAYALIADLERRGAYIHIPRADRDYAIDVGLRMLLLRHLAIADDADHYRANPKERVLLRYYANAIAHLFEQEEKTATEADRSAARSAASEDLARVPAGDPRDLPDAVEKAGGETAG